MNKLKPIPEVGKTYDYFDDGKIRESRRQDVVINSIVPFKDAPEELKKEYKEEYTRCHWLYAQDTDCFIHATLVFEKFPDEDIWFVRTRDGGWFSLGLWAGELDIDGKLKEKLDKVE